MKIPPTGMWPHITIEEIKNLTEQESDILLFICNVWAPVRPPIPDEQNPHPVSLSVIRYAKRESILDRVKQAEKLIKEQYKEVYTGLKTKLNIT